MDNIVHNCWNIFVLPLKIYYILKTLNLNNCDYKELSILREPFFTSLFKRCKGWFYYLMLLATFQERMPKKLG